MTEETRKSITSLTKAGVRPRQILTHLRLDADQENPFFTRHDVYNVKNQQRRQALGVLSPVQALLQNLERESWFWQYEKDELDRVTKLFFSRSSCRDMLTRNSEVLAYAESYGILGRSKRQRSAPRSFDAGPDAAALASAPGE